MRTAYGCGSHETRGAGVAKQVAWLDAQMALVGATVAKTQLAEMKG